MISCSSSLPPDTGKSLPAGWLAAVAVFVVFEGKHMLMYLLQAMTWPRGYTLA